MKKLLFLMLLHLIAGCSFNENKRIESNAIILKKEIFFTCDNEYKDDCKVMIRYVNGTASRIFWNNNYYWLTAGHICDSMSKDEKIIKREINAIVAGSGNVEYNDIIKVDNKKDLCLLSADQGSIKKIAKNNPNPGDKVYAIAYPAGIYDPSMLPIYDGRWSGKISHRNMCAVTIPVSSGSSGSAVIDKDGKITNIVISVLSDFNHLTLTTCNEDLLEFLNETSIN